MLFLLFKIKKRSFFIFQMCLFVLFEQDGSAHYYPLVSVFINCTFWKGCFKVGVGNIKDTRRQQMYTEKIKRTLYTVEQLSVKFDIWRVCMGESMLFRLQLSEHSLVLRVDILGLIAPSCSLFTFFTTENLYLFHHLSASSRFLIRSTCQISRFQKRGERACCNCDWTDRLNPR